MYKLEKSGPHGELKLKSTAGAGRIATGLVLMVQGFFLLTIAVVYLKMANSSAVILSIIGVFLLLLSLLFFFLKSRIVFDKGRGEILKWYEIIVPVKTARWGTEEFEKISIKKEKPNKKSKVLLYPVRLVKNGSDDFLEIDSPMNYPHARMLAEKIAQTLELPIHDESTGQLQVREFTDINKSVRQLAEGRGEKVDVPPTPADMVSSIKHDDGGVIVEIPPTVIDIFAYFPAVVGIIMSVFVAILFGKFLSSLFTDTPYLLPAIFGAVVLFSVTLWKVTKAKSKKGWVIKVSPLSLNITEIRGGGKKIIEILADELEEFRLIESPFHEGFGISDDGGITMESGFTSEEELRNPSRMMKRDEYLASPQFQKLARWLFKLLPKPYIAAVSDKIYVEIKTSIPEKELKYIYAILRKALIE